MLRTDCRHRRGHDVAVVGISVLLGLVGWIGSVSAAEDDSTDGTIVYSQASSFRDYEEGTWVQIMEPAPWAILEKDKETHYVVKAANVTRVTDSIMVIMNGEIVGEFKPAIQIEEQYFRGNMTPRTDNIALLAVISQNKGRKTIQLTRQMFALTFPVTEAFPSGCVTPAFFNSKYAFSSLHRGIWLIDQEEDYRKGVACLVDSIQHSSPTRAYPYAILWHHFEHVKEIVTADRTERLLKRLYPNYTIGNFELYPYDGDYLYDIDLSQVRTMDMSEYSNMVCAFTGLYYMVGAGIFPHAAYGASIGEHYQLLKYLASFAPFQSILIDLGTRHSASALALAEGAAKSKSSVLSFNIQWDELKGNAEACGMTLDEFIDRVPKNLAFSVGNAVTNYPNELLSAFLILLDTEHDGPFEYEVYEFLKKGGFHGILILDDIYLNPAMDAFWGQITEPKVDLTKHGHHSGTGLVDFTGWGIRVREF